MEAQYPLNSVTAPFVAMPCDGVFPPPPPTSAYGYSHTRTCQCATAEWGGDLRVTRVNSDVIPGTLLRSYTSEHMLGRAGHTQSSAALMFST